MNTGQSRRERRWLKAALYHVIRRAYPWLTYPILMDAVKAAFAHHVFVLREQGLTMREIAATANVTTTTALWWSPQGSSRPRSRGHYSPGLLIRNGDYDHLDSPAFPIRRPGKESLGRRFQHSRHRWEGFPSTGEEGLRV